MVLRLISPEEEVQMKTEMKRDVVHLGTAGAIHHGQVIEHLRQVLTYFAVKPGYAMFYIGITNDLDTRLASHRRNKPQFKLMCPIYAEPSNYVENAFDRLEQEAIRQFSGGIVNPKTHRVALQCTNGPGGASPKTWLYILVG